MPADNNTPFQWPTHKKWQLTLVACYATFIIGINSTSITAAATPINTHFNLYDTTSLPNSYWPVTSWNLGAAIAPMLMLPLMEEHGMRPGYLGCYIFFFLFVLPQALAQNFATLIISRFFAGCAGGVVQDVMDGVIADVWEGPVARSLPVTCYVFSLLAGVSFGPVFGGAVIAGGLGWRWIFWIQLIVYGLSLPLVWIYFHETRPHKLKGAQPVGKSDISSPPDITPTTAPKIEAKPQISTTATNNMPASEATTPSSKQFFYNALILPTKLLLTEPVVASFTLLSALSYGLLFLATQSIPLIYTSLYAFTESQTGLLQISLVIGEALGFLLCLLQNKIFRLRLERAALRVGRTQEAALQSLDNGAAEARLYLCCISTFLLLAGGLFTYGFTSTPSIHWALPALGLILLGAGSMTVMQAIMSYITDSHSLYAASASAAVCAGENVFAALLPLAANALYNGVGYRWGSGVLGFISVGLGVAPVVLVLFGRRVRGRSRFMAKARMEGGSGEMVVGIG